MADQYDVIIIGAGPGGYVAAIRAAQLGLKTAIVEREHLGGICLNWGCIPTKALLRSAEIFRNLEMAREFGLPALKMPHPDVTKMAERSRRVSGQLNGGVGFLMKKNKVDVIWGQARLVDARTIEVGAPSRPPVEPQHKPPATPLGAGRYSARHIVIATGARPRILPGFEALGEAMWTYFEAMMPKALPKSLIVMGSGAIGIEFASFYNALGCAVTVVEMLPRILPAEDEEISSLARKHFERQGIVVHTGTTICDPRRTSQGVEVTIAMPSGKTGRLGGDKLISAVGVTGNTETLNLEGLGVEVEKGQIKTSGAGATNIPGIYAIGDVAGAPMLAHKAEHEGVACIEAIAGKAPHAPARARIPACTYCHPQIASVGLTEKAALTAGHNVKIGRFPYAGNGKALALGEGEGLVKTVFDAQSGQLLGAHLIGAEVTELIGALCVAMTLETTEEELMHTIFPHPTLSETLHESVLSAYGRAIHN